MGKSAKKPDLETLREELRKAGLRATGPRVAVLRCLHAAGGAVSHSDLSSELAPEGWDRATVYRNLMDLTEAGLLKRIDHGDHTWRFTLRKNEVEQYKQAFFVCDVSGEMTPLPNGSVTVSIGRGAPKALRAGEFVVHVRGIGDKYRRDR